MKIQNKLKKVASVLVLVILIIIFAYYIKIHIPEFKQLTVVNPFYILILIILFLINYFLIGVVTKELLKPLGICLRMMESFGLSIITGFYNLIMPFRGGAGVRAIYLKEKHDFSYLHFFSTLSATYVLIFLIASLLGLLSTLLIYLTEGYFSWIVSLTFFGIFILLSLVVIFSPRVPETKNKWINKFINVINGWHLIKNNKRVIFATLLLNLAQIIISAVMFYLQFRVFGIEINLIKCIFLSAISNISMLVSITPANLGITEAITVFSASAIGISVTDSLPATLLGRAVSFLVLFILGPIFSYVLLKHKPKKNERQN